MKQQAKIEVYNLSIPLMDGGMAIFSVPIPLTRENYDLIYAFLELFELAFTTPIDRDC